MRSAPLQHLQRLVRLLQELGSSGIFLEEHKYDGKAFGSFELVLTGTSGRARFIWDGKDSILETQFESRMPGEQLGAWVHDAFFTVDSNGDVFAEIGSNAELLLAEPRTSRTQRGVH